MRYLVQFVGALVLLLLLGTLSLTGGFRCSHSAPPSDSVFDKIVAVCVFLGVVAWLVLRWLARPRRDMWAESAALALIVQKHGTNQDRAAVEAYRRHHDIGANNPEYSIGDKLARELTLAPLYAAGFVDDTSQEPNRFERRVRPQASETAAISYITGRIPESKANVLERPEGGTNIRRLVLHTQFEGYHFSHYLRVPPTLNLR